MGFKKFVFGAAVCINAGACTETGRLSPCHQNASRQQKQLLDQVRKGQASHRSFKMRQTLCQNEYVKLLNKHVLPGLQDEAFRSKFEQAVERFKAKNELKEAINSTKRKKEINSIAKALKKSLRSDWHDGYEDQTAYKGDIVSKVEDWLQDLFFVAVEQGRELTQVQDCLIFIEDHVLAAMNDNCRTSWSDCHDCFQISIKSSAKTARYEGMPEDVIQFLWRDLLLVAISHGDAKVLDAFKEHRANSKPDDWQTINSLTQLHLYVPGPEHDKHAKAHWSDMQLFDDWHTEAMKAAMPQLKSLLSD